jgi:hypothetical protein
MQSRYRLEVDALARIQLGRIQLGRLLPRTKAALPRSWEAAVDAGSLPLLLTGGSSSVSVTRGSDAEERDSLCRTAASRAERLASVPGRVLQSGGGQFAAETLQLGPRLRQSHVTQANESKFLRSRFDVAEPNLLRPVRACPSPGINDGLRGGQARRHRRTDSHNVREASSSAVAGPSYR